MQYRNSEALELDLSTDIAVFYYSTISFIVNYSTSFI